MTSFHYTVRDELGLHMRPAGLFVKQAKNFTCAITLKKEGAAPANAKSVFGVMGLAIKHGESITVFCDGDDEIQTAQELEKFCIKTF